MPELGDSVEVVETATPRSFYEDTRRKLGMVGRPSGALGMSAEDEGKTIFANVFLVSDTNASGLGLAGLSQSALNLADRLTNRGR
jgi:phytoene dehydrogenase-like protein